MIIIGMDPSLCNWGICRGVLDTRLTVDMLDIEQTHAEGGPKNLDDLARMGQLVTFLKYHLSKEALIYAELPTGSRNARGMVSYAAVTALLAYLISEGYNIKTVTQREVKLNTAGYVDASKATMIAWAVANYPEAPWPYVRKHGQLQINASKAEHMADAVAVAHTGLLLYPPKLF